MKLRTVLFLYFLSFVVSATAQNYTGVWEGHFYFVKKKHKMNVRIEVTQKDDDFIGVVSTRGFEENSAYGCDYIVFGHVVESKFILIRTDIRRGVSLTEYDCSSFDRIELPFTKNDTTDVKGRWFWKEDVKEVLFLKKIATEISEIAKEEINESERKKAAREADRKKAIMEKKPEKVKKIHWSETTTIDELRVKSKVIVITVSSVEKDPKASLSAFVNGKIVALNSNLAKNVLVIRIEDVALHNRVVFLNNSATGEQLDIKITFKQGKKTKEWITSIEALDNALLQLNHQSNNSYRDNFQVYEQGPF
jgi:hypothetical protein